MNCIIIIIIQLRKYLKEVSQALLFAKILLLIDRKMLSQIFLVDSSQFKTEMAFVFQWMFVKWPYNVKFYLNSTPAQRVFKSPNILCFFLRILLISLTIHVRIICIWFCLLQIFAIDHRLYIHNTHTTTANEKRARRKACILHSMRQRLTLQYWTHQPQPPLSLRHKDLLQAGAISLVDTY